jgi:hypothetical protein
VREERREERGRRGERSEPSTYADRGHRRQSEQ